MLKREKKSRFANALIAQIQYDQQKDTYNSCKNSTSKEIFAKLKPAKLPSHRKFSTLSIFSDFGASPGFKSSTLLSRNAIYFSIIVISIILLLSQYKTCEFHCWDHVCKVNEWCLVDCFFCKFSISTQIMVCDYCSAKCKKFAACGRLLIDLCTIFFCNSKYLLIRTLQQIPCWTKTPWQTMYKSQQPHPMHWASHCSRWLKIKMLQVATN